MSRLLVLMLLVAALAACGGSSTKPLYESGDWRVVVAGSKATAQHRVDGKWQADTTGAVHVSVIGPRQGTTAPGRPQVAAELRAGSALVESGLWLDGVELFTKGGSLSPRRGTIYGAPDSPLASGTHTAVAYARTAGHATAVAWTFRVA
jgi:ABC-type glycerol-3-phosphate transport system substrate-binding protein